MKDNPSFFSRVYDVVRKIPYGRVSTYGAIAQYLSSRGSARMVGWAMNQSHTVSDGIPAHRVVNRNGQLSGKHHFGGQDVMKNLLESEGIPVIDDHINDFDKYYWDPSANLD